MKHTYAIYMIDVALEIERRRSNDAGLPPEIRETALKRIAALTKSRDLLVSDGADKAAAGKAAEAGT